MKKFACFLTGMLLALLAWSGNTSPAGHFPATPPTDSLGYNGSLNVCQGGSILLTANFAPAGSSFQWTKNGVAIGGATGSTFTASTSGTYSVIVTDAGNPLNWPSVNVNIVAFPVAAFNSTPSSQCANVPVHFTNLSTGAASYTWSFGDPASSANNTSILANPLHEFVGAPGNATQSFTVRLIADIAGCKDTATSSVTVKQLPGTELGGTGYTLYNGLPYFTQCASATSGFTFTNQSSTAATNTNYIIKWGDNAPDFSSTSWSATSHTYGVGTWSLQFIVAGQNGCIDTATYFVFVGNNPAVGLNNPGNTFICSGTSLTFPISGTGANPPGTTYAVLFNDGSAPTTFPHPAPADVTHLFSIGSCGTTSGSFANSFQASIQASNPCGTSAASVVPIYVSQKGTALFSTFPGDTICTTNTLSLTNVSLNAFGVSSSGVCTIGKGVWSITPATGWSVVSGTLGNTFGVSDPGTWINGSTALGVNFTTPGVYSIKLKIGASALCGGDSIVKTVCINPAPVAAFTLSGVQGCAPYTVSATNGSNTPNCGNNTYQWSVSYSNAGGCTPGSSSFVYTGGTSSTSANPQFQFNNPGVYTLSLVTKSPLGTCTSAPVTQTVTVKAKPAVTINAPATICQNTTVNPTAVVNNCYSSTAATYLWTFPGATPSSSTSAIPGNVVFNTSGIQVISLAVTNDCGTTTVTRSITVNPAPDVIVPAGLIVCAGTATGAINFSSAVNGTAFNWTNSTTSIGLPASGTGNIASFIPVNTGSSPVTATITVVPVNGCIGPSQSFTLTVNPRPGNLTVVSPVRYCLNETASPLTATPASGNSLTWYTNAALTGGTTTPIVPPTSAAANLQYYVTQTNSYNCVSPVALIAVIVSPKITGNQIGTDQTICTSSGASAISSSVSPGGGSGSFTYAWEASTDGGLNWTPISGAVAASYTPMSVATSTQFRRIVQSSTCADTSNTVTITVQGNLNNTDISAPQTICSGTVPTILSGQTPAGGSGSFAFQWESSPNSSAWTLIAGATGLDYQPGALSATTYFRRKTTSGPCSVYSSVVMVSVNAKPVITQKPDMVLCNGSAGSTTLSALPSGASFSWMNSNPAIGVPASGVTAAIPLTVTNNSMPKIPVAGTIAAVATYTSNGVGCLGDTMFFNVTVLPTIVIAPIPDTVVCTGTPFASYAPAHDAGAFAGSSVTYTWGITGQGTIIIGGGNTALPAISTLNTTNVDAVSTVTVSAVYHLGTATCTGPPEVYMITVKPGTPPAQAGPDTTLCAASTYNMQAQLPSGSTGIWTQLGTTTATIVSPNSPASSITGLTAGSTYYFVWTISGFASCPPTRDTVIIKIDGVLINTINNSTQTICAGQGVTIAGDPPSGGNGSYLYQWQQSADNVSWTNLSGQTAASLSFSPAQTVFVRRVVLSLPCSSTSLSTQIIVQPSLTNNTISADQNICLGTVPVQINGSLPAGGSGTYQYQWQQSSNGGLTWADIPGATAQHFQPGTLTAGIKYRRRAFTALCAGPQASTSNVVTITVNPDAHALFNPATVSGCIPFNLTPAIVNLQAFPAQNAQYLWYADNAFIGAGSVFPGYQMNTADDTVTIRLIVTSAFGCKSDTISRDFRTFKIPQPSYTISDTVGCGPLSVSIVNTTPDISSFGYYWTFGNGISTTVTQPGTIILLPNPASGDTTYSIKLHAVSACDTVVFVRTVRVKSKPKALFAPNHSVGCSPMLVSFNNTSAGIGNTYTWNFGDGSAPVVTTSPAAVTHTFYTGVQDTFYVKLVAANECGSDSLTYAIVVSPNKVHLDFAINGNQFSGCSPHTVKFINNSSGASAFTWNFGDGNSLNTTLNIDTVTHTYILPGNYTVTLFATNGCSDTTSTENVIIYPKPAASFSANNYTACIGNAIQFTNTSTGAGSFLWQFDDGLNSTLAQPVHIYTTPGLYHVKLIAYSLNVAGTYCTDSVIQLVQVVSGLPGSFTATDTVGHCTPFTISFANQNLPSANATWNFGDGNSGTGDNVSHTYTQAGIYPVTLTSTAPGGCVYTSIKTVKILGPGGNWTHTTGYLCGNAAASFQVAANNFDTLVYQFGDGIAVSSTSNTMFHSYLNPGTYFPTLIIKNNAGCQVFVKGIDSIRVDKIKSGFTATMQNSCGQTSVAFADTSHAFFGKTLVKWNFGDGNSGTGTTTLHSYTASGSYTIQQIVIGTSGCSDTVNRTITVIVNTKPNAAIVLPPTACAGTTVNFASNIQSANPVNIIKWTISNGVTNQNALFNYNFSQPGTYTVQLIAGTVNGCFDTTSTAIIINPTPTIAAGNDINLCRGNSATLFASGPGLLQWNWSPLQGLSCTACASPVASPLVTTPYVVQGTNGFGCSGYDTLIVTVAQPFKVQLSSADSICIGGSTNLLASGASSYSWSPGIGLNNTTISNPTASPAVTTTYRVVGHDGFNCFTDTAFVTVAVGQYPVINLGPDLTLPTGTLQPLLTTVQNGPIKNWSWSPAADLSCNNCPLPVANIRKDVTYIVKGTTAYGCSDTDTLTIRTFCQSAQVFIPNAFTPDGDGFNDILMVRASGVALVKSFRIFNRWGEVVFERGNFQPNLPQFGWDGKIKGTPGGPEVYVYTAEVVCENGTSFTYKGNVSLLK